MKKTYSSRSPTDRFRMFNGSQSIIRLTSLYDLCIYKGSSSVYVRVVPHSGSDSSQLASMEIGMDGRIFTQFCSASRGVVVDELSTWNIRPELEGENVNAIPVRK